MTGNPVLTNDLKSGFQTRDYKSGFQIRNLTSGNLNPGFNDYESSHRLKTLTFP